MIAPVMAGVNPAPSRAPANNWRTSYRETLLAEWVADEESRTQVQQVSSLGDLPLNKAVLARLGYKYVQTNHCPMSCTHSCATPSYPPFARNQRLR